MTLPEPTGLVCARTRMDEAIAVARTTPAGDIPVGAIIYGPTGEVLGRGVNRRETDKDPLGHAEIMAIKEAVASGKLTDGWRLSDCELVVTLEPCTMCAGALMGARIGSIVFGAYEPKTGACGSAFDVVRDPAVLHSAHVRGGVREAECQAMLAEFFTQLRKENDHPLA